MRVNWTDRLIWRVISTRKNTFLCYFLGRRFFDTSMPTSFSNYIYSFNKLTYKLNSSNSLWIYTNICFLCFFFSFKTLNSNYWWAVCWKVQQQQQQKHKYQMRSFVYCGQSENGDGIDGILWNSSIFRHSHFNFIQIQIHTSSLIGPQNQPVFGPMYFIYTTHMKNVIQSQMMIKTKNRCFLFSLFRFRVFF